MISRLLSILSVAALPLVCLPAAAEAKGYRCKADVSGNTWSLRIAKGRVQAAGDNHRAKVLKNGSIEVIAYGEAWRMAPGGRVTGRQGGSMGKHTCDMAKAVAALKGK